MIFNSVDFLVFFCVVFPVFFLLKDGLRTSWLVVASYFFYGYWSWKYLALLLFTMSLDYVIALAIQKSQEHRRKTYLVVSLVLNLGILFVFKYFNFFFDVVREVTGTNVPILSLVLPFGISFYTFHAMSYVIDVYRRTIPAESDFLKYSGYIMFFPQLVAGPIARASHLLPQFETPKRLKSENLYEGIYLVMRGYFFKVVLADAFGGFTDAFFSGAAGSSPTLVTQAVYFFAFQIYCDFCGYTDIARGISRFFDFKLVENFRSPYFSVSLTEFWHRWHMSLSTWLRDYLYIPLGGNRDGQWKTYRNLMLTMMLGGLWHGANLTFLVWGTLHGLYLAAEKAASGTMLAANAAKIPRIIRGILVFHLVCFAWIFFRAETFSQAATVLIHVAALFTAPLTNLNIGQLHYKLWPLVFLLFTFEYFEIRLDLHKRFCAAPKALRLATVYAAIAFICLFAQLNPREFLYFQF